MYVMYICSMYVFMHTMYVCILCLLQLPSDDNDDKENDSMTPGILGVPESGSEYAVFHWRRGDQLWTRCEAHTDKSVRSLVPIIIALLLPTEHLQLLYMCMYVLYVCMFAQYCILCLSQFKFQFFYIIHIQCVQIYIHIYIYTNAYIHTYIHTYIQYRPQKSWM
jgi:hypothetical protein